MIKKAIFFTLMTAALCMVSCGNEAKADTAYPLSYVNHIEKGSEAFVTVCSAEKAPVLTAPDGTEYDCGAGRQYLRLQIQFDLSGTDYSLNDIVLASDCFKDTDSHSYDEAVTNALNGFELKGSELKKGTVSVADQVEEGFTSEYMPIGITDKRGISQTVKYIIG